MPNLKYLSAENHFLFSNRFSRRDKKKAASLVLVLFFGLLFLSVTRINAQGWITTEWSFSRSIYINTTSNGANVSGHVIKVPVLIKLDSANFYHGFLGSDQNGEDIRFSRAGSTWSLYYEIERWDYANKKAEIWVLVDTVYGDDSTEIIMYWGNPTTYDQSNSEDVFDTDNGFAGVYHLGETSSGPVYDATANSIDVTSSEEIENVTQGAAGIAGPAAGFQGDGFISVADDPRLYSDGDFSVSVWFKPASGNNGGIVCKRGISSPIWENYYIMQRDTYTEYAYATADEEQMWYDEVEPITQGQWHYSALVRKDSYLYVYENGNKIKVDSNLTEAMFDGWGIVCIGALDDNAVFFTGTIDEVRISKSARSDDWYKFNYKNISITDSVIQFGALIGDVDTARITAHPSDTTIVFGRSATFSVSASGTATIIYQWQKNEVNIANANFSSYTISAVSMADSGASFRCIVTNGIGSDTSNTAVLTVLYPPDSTLTLLSPNGGESWSAGSIQTIAWTSTGVVGGVRLEYSLDSGRIWNQIIASTPNDGARSWTLPESTSTQVMVRILESVDGIPGDTSDGVFTIEMPSSLALSSPNGGESWMVGQSYIIVWSASGPVEKIKAEYSTNGGADWAIIADSAEVTDSIIWTIPDSISDSCRVRVSDYSDGNPIDSSNAFFSIIPVPTLMINNPAADTVLASRSFYDIAWSSVGSIDSVKIEFSVNNGTDWNVVTESTPDDGNYHWIVPDTNSDSCLLKISDVRSSAASDTSSNIFRISSSPSVRPVVIPHVTGLVGVGPNPVSGMLNVQYGLAEPGAVELLIYNIQGKLINRLAKSSKSAGYHQLIWHGRDFNNHRVSNGLYLLRLRIGDLQYNKHVMVIR